MSGLAASLISTVLFATASTRIVVPCPLIYFPSYSAPPLFYSPLCYCWPCCILPSIHGPPSRVTRFLFVFFLVLYVFCASVISKFCIILLRLCKFTGFCHKVLPEIYTHTGHEIKPWKKYHKNVTVNLRKYL